MSEQIKRLMADEQRILDALTDAFQRGKMGNAHFGPAWDVTVVRLAALSFALSPSEGQRDSGREVGDG